MYNSPFSFPEPCANTQLTLHRYYVLVAACVFARKREWLRNACLAAALVFPAVAAIHGIVLASIHVNGQFPCFEPYQCPPHLTAPEHRSC